MTYAVTNGRTGDPATYPGYVSVANGPTSPVAGTAVLTKVQGPWPAGVPPAQDQNGVYGSFESYPDPQQYSPGIYAQY